MMILLFAGAYTRQVHIPLPDSAQAAVTILRGDESAWNGEAAEERCLVCCRIPMMFSNPRIAGDFWKTWDFQSLYLSESRKWRSAEMGQVILGVIRVPKRLHPHPSEDTTRVISRSVSKMATDRSACASTSRLTNAGEVKSALAAFYEFHMRLKPHYVSV